MQKSNDKENKNSDANILITDWIEQNDIRTEDGKKIDFKKFPFQVDLYNDLHPKQAIIKPAQIGATTLHIIKAFWVGRHFGWNGLYTLPTFTDVKDMSRAKVDRIVEQNPYFKKMISGDDTMGQKIINVSEKIRPYIMFRGCHTAPTMFSADVHYGDEVDTSDQTYFAQMYTRLQASDYRYTWYFSHPSSPRFGIDAYYAMSDKREWFIDCPCGNHFYLDWTKHANAETKKYECDLCHQEVTNEQRLAGKWEATEPNPTGDWHGYHINLMMNVMYSCEDLWLIRENKDDFYFNTRVLGVPDASGDRSVDAETILQNCTEEIFQDDNSPVIISVDPNKTLRLLIGNGRGIFHAEESDDFNIVDKYMEMYPSAILVVDSGGEIWQTRIWQEKYFGRVWTIYYGNDKTGEKYVTWDEEKYTATIEVNRCITECINNFKLRRIALQGKRKEWEMFTEHFTSLYAVIEENAIGIPKKIWKTTKRKDFALCATYHVIAVREFNEHGDVWAHIRL